MSRATRAASRTERRFKLSMAQVGVVTVLSAALGSASVTAQEPGGTPACERAARLALTGATVTEARLVAAGAFAGPPAPYSGADLTPLYKTLPAFCRLLATAKPTPDSDIKIEVWVPV